MLTDLNAKANSIGNEGAKAFATALSDGKVPLPLAGGVVGGRVGGVALAAATCPAEFIFNRTFL